MSPNHNDNDADEMLPEYDLSGGVRGKHFLKYSGVFRGVLSQVPVTRTFVFPDHESLDASHIGNLLFLVKGAYNVGIDAAERTRVGRIADWGVALKDHISRIDVATMQNVLARDLGRANVVPTDLSYHSPLTMTLTGHIEGLWSAAVLAGVKPDLTVPANVEMPSVSASVTALRKALYPERSFVGFGINVVRIRLSKEEFAELMRVDPATRERGGFQRLLVSLQLKVDRRSRILSLSGWEVELLVRYGRKPFAGGWQARIRRVFGQHLKMT
jgi:hypothetical protein